jgi:hypothetical protein
VLRKTIVIKFIKAVDACSAFSFVLNATCNR